MNKLKWEATRMGNVVLHGDNFFISYRGSMNSSNPMLSIYNSLGAAGGLETANSETALRVIEPRKFLILNGDFRKEYEAAFPSLDACVAVYEKHKAEHRSDWSED